MKLFHSFDTTDWTRVISVVGAISGGWLVLGQIIPEQYHHTGSVILQAATTFVALMIKSGKSRTDKIVEKIEAHEADAVKKAKEIDTLIESEVKEKQ